MSLIGSVLYLFLFFVFIIFRKIYCRIMEDKIHYSTEEYRNRLDEETKKYKKELEVNYNVERELKQRYRWDFPLKTELRKNMYTKLGLSLADKERFHVQDRDNELVPLFELARRGKVPRYEFFGAYPFKMDIIGDTEKDEENNRFVSSDVLHEFYKAVSEMINSVHPEYYICRYTIHTSRDSGYYIYKWNVFGDLDYKDRKYERTPISNLSGDELSYCRFDRWGKYINRVEKYYYG